VDIIIPIFMSSDQSKPINRFGMSCILIQIKSSAKKQAVFIDEKKLGFFSPGDEEQNKRPYITLTMELGVQHQQPKPKRDTKNWKWVGIGTGAGIQSGKDQPTTQFTESPAEVTVGIAGKQNPSRKAQPKSTSNGSHPRYAIYVTGCSSKVYGVIKPEEEHTYARLLTSRTLLNEHPRGDYDYITAVKWLKPMWEYGPSFERYRLMNDSEDFPKPDVMTAPADGIGLAKDIMEEDRDDDVDV